MNKTIRHAVLPFAMIAAFAVTDAQAQGRGKEAEKERTKVEQKRQENEGREWELRRREGERLEDGRRRGVPPGWCIGKGNPHNTVENCGRRGERYDPRRDDRDSDRRPTSYAEAHEAYHRYEDAQCRARANDRPLDLAHRLRVRAECDRQHDEWHRRAGRRHD